MSASNIDKIIEKCEEYYNFGKKYFQRICTTKKYPGLKGAIKGLFSSEVEIKKAVDDISFDIDDGEIVGYIGSNGAGKSTTIKIMIGILKPTYGKCIVNNVDPNEYRMANA